MVDLGACERTTLDHLREPYPFKSTFVLSSRGAVPCRAQALKLGIDVHADRYVGVFRLKGHTPHLAQTSKPAAVFRPSSFGLRDVNRKSF